MMILWDRNTEAARTISQALIDIKMHCKRNLFTSRKCFIHVLYLPLYSCHLAQTVDSDSKVKLLQAAGVQH